MKLYHSIFIILGLVVSGCVDSESEVLRSTLPVISVEGNSATEGEDITLFISISKANEEDVTFSWTTDSGGTATEGVDYLEQAGTGVIRAGSLSTSVTITTISDVDDEINETIQFTLFNTTNVEVGQLSAVAEILDDDTPDISINDASGPEGSNITFTATLSRTSLKNVTFEWTTSDISTTASSDYTPVIAVPATIPAGSLTATINVAALADGFDDLNNGETFNVSLGNVVNANIVDGEGLGTISDSDFPQISINDIVAVENGTATFTISSNIASEQAMTVNYSTANGTALTPGDYSATAGTATIPAGSVSTTVDVVTVNNSSFEGSENFVLNLSAPVNATILDNQGIATLNDDDAAPSLAVDSLSFVEGSIFSFTVTLTGSTELDTQFDWATSNGSAVEPGDYTSGSASGVTILAGNSTATINITSLEDLVDEPDQTFNVTLSSPVNATIGTAVGVGTIQDNEAAPDMSIDDQALVEGGIATFTITLSTMSEADIGFDITTVDGTTTGGSDYTSNTQSLVIAAGNLTQTFNVTTTDDAVACEGLETMNATISNAPSANVIDAIGVLTITDNDPSLSVNDITVAENAGNATFTITPSSICAGQNIDVDWVTANNTALSPGDYTAGGGTATILAGNPNVTVNIPLTDDGLAEIDEDFLINLSNPVNAVILDAQGLATINDDDTVPDISISDDTVTEGTDAVVSVSLNTIAGSDITVDYTTTAGTALPVSEFTVTAGTLTIPAGSLSQNINIPTNNDTTEEVSKTFTMDISNPNLGNIIDSSGLLTLNDNDAIPDISIDDVNVNEGGNLVFTVSLTNPSDDPVSFNWTTVDGSAVAPTHYTSNSGTGEVITAGNTTTTLTVVTVDNTEDGLAKNLTVSLSAAVNGNIVDNTGVGTINDNDPVPSLSVDSPSAVEGGAITFTVSLDATSEQNVDFNWATSNGTAVTPTDYVGASGSDTITAGNLSTTVVITGADDATFEADETFNLTLSAPVNATIGTAVGVATVTENETAPTLSIDSVATTEGGVLAFTVTPSFTVPVALSVDYTTADVTAVAGSDYTATTNTLVIPASSAGENINITTTDDTASEDSETLTVTLSNPVNSTIAGGVGTGTINDNDAVRLNTSLAGAQDVQSMQIAPDSSRIIYLADESTAGTFELYSVTSGGSGLVKISGTLTAGGNVTQYAISPDSSKVIFIADANTDEEFEIFSVNLNGTGLTNLTGGLVAGGDVTDFEILDDSSQVVFLGDKTADEQFELFAVALTGGAVTTLNSALVAGGDVTSFACSDDSSKVVFIADRDGDEDFEIYSVNDDGTGEVQINSAMTASGDVQSFAIAPNSSRVAFIADKDVDEDFELFAAPIGGGTNDQINGALVAGGDVSQFAWSANSSKIVYLADQSVDEDVEIYSADDDGANGATLNGALVASGDVIDFAISADSATVVYLADQNIDAVDELFSSPIAGGGETALHTALGASQRVTDFDISADSAKVVYVADQTSTNEFEVRSVNTNGTSNTLLSGVLVAGGDVSAFQIAADSSKILFLADKDTDFTNELYSVAIGGGAITQVSSDLVGGGNVSSDFLGDSGSSFSVFRADYSNDDIIEILSHSF